MDKPSNQTQGIPEKDNNRVNGQAYNDVTNEWTPNEEMILEKSFHEDPIPSIDILQDLKKKLKKNILFINKWFLDKRSTMSQFQKQNLEPDEVEYPLGRGKYRRPRTKFSEKQVAILQATFSAKKHPPKSLYEEMALKTDLPLKAIQYWFQNMRQREKELERQGIRKPTDNSLQPQPNGNAIQTQPNDNAVQTQPINPRTELEREFYPLGAKMPIVNPNVHPASQNEHNNKNVKEQSVTNRKTEKKTVQKHLRFEEAQPKKTVRPEGSNLNISENKPQNPPIKSILKPTSKSNVETLHFKPSDYQSVNFGDSGRKNERKNDPGTNTGYIRKPFAMVIKDATSVKGGEQSNDNKDEYHGNHENPAVKSQNKITRSEPLRRKGNKEPKGQKVNEEVLGIKKEVDENHEHFNMKILDVDAIELENNKKAKTTVIANIKSERNDELGDDDINDDSIFCDVNEKYGLNIVDSNAEDFDDADEDVNEKYGLNIVDSEPIKQPNIKNEKESERFQMQIVDEDTTDIPIEMNYGDTDIEANDNYDEDDDIEFIEIKDRKPFKGFSVTNA